LSSARSESVLRQAQDERGVARGEPVEPQAQGERVFQQPASPYHALACDYDRTLTAGENVRGGEPLAALERLRASGRRLILVTGRQLPDLLHIFPGVAVCDRVVAENGGLLYRPATAETQLLAPPASLRFLEALRARGAEPLFEGRTVVATVRPHDVTAAEVIRELGLELEITVNRESVMVLPRGVNKGTGLAVALQELHLSFEETVGIGDAENDEAFLRLCGFSAAVANAIPALKNRVGMVTTAAYGAGVAELVDRLIGDGLGTPMTGPAKPSGE